MSDQPLQPEIIVFAGPNGSGKSTIKKNAKTVGMMCLKIKSGRGTKSH